MSFRAKTWYLHMWKYHLCYGYIINRAFHTQKLLKWNGLVFHWCLYNKWNITWPLGDTKFLFSCWKNTRREISYLRAAMQYPLFICVSYCYLIRFSISSNFFSFIPIRAYLIKFISTCLVYLTLEDGQFDRPKCLINSSLFPLLAACLFYLL